MNKTNEYNSPAFLTKRIKEQTIYIKDVSKRYKAGLISGSRARELTTSAYQMKVIYEKQIRTLYGWNNPPLQ